MAAIPRTYIDRFTKAINSISAEAQKELAKELTRIDYTQDVATIREMAINIMQVWCGGASDAASVLAAEFYDGLRERDVGERIGAIADSGRKPDATSGAVRAFVQDIVDGRPDRFKELCLERLDYETKLSANQTVANNGQRDPRKPRYARVPTGTETCEFCIMLASRGFVYRSEELASHAHANCDCRVVPSWDKDKAAVEGYDPDYYLELWKDPDAAKHMAKPVGPKHMAGEQRNDGPDVPSIKKRTTKTSIAECATSTNPLFDSYKSAYNDAVLLSNELNTMKSADYASYSKYVADWKRKKREYDQAVVEYKRLYREWNQNCQRCTVAYELRRRGYDVEANRRLARNDTVWSGWQHLFVNQQWTKVGNSDATVALSNLEKTIGGYGDGSRSIVYVIWNTGNAHVFIAERQHGKVVYVDPQSGTVGYDWVGDANPESVLVSRVDDKELDTKYLKKAVRIRK